jgi:hypothetical protein
MAMTNSFAFQGRPNKGGIDEVDYVGRDMAYCTIIMIVN